jgi:uncharacterized membrane protein
MRSILSQARKYVLAGVLTIGPILLTWLIFEFLLKLLIRHGGPVVAWIANGLRFSAPSLSDWLIHPWVQWSMAVVLILVSFYLIGWLATQVVGRRLIAMFDAVMERIPIVQTIYGAIRRSLDILQQEPRGVASVVLIDFPSPEMKTVGLVTRTLVDDDTGRELAVVLVPTTPNPTSGYLEIVPLDKLTSTNWTMEEAMTFVISGGAVVPESINYDKGADAPKEPSQLKDS